MVHRFWCLVLYMRFVLFQVIGVLSLIGTRINQQKRSAHPTSPSRDLLTQRETLSLHRVVGSMLLFLFFPLRLRHRRHCIIVLLSYKDGNAGHIIIKYSAIIIITLVQIDSYTLYYYIIIIAAVAYEITMIALARLPKVILTNV